MTIANPCVVSIANHGLRDGTGVVFTTTGSLPTGVTSGTTYYSRSTASGTFNLYDTSAHAIAGGTTGRVTTTGSQSGTHTCKSAYRNALTTDEKARYGSAGSERIYDGLASWRSARNTAGVSVYDHEYCEIGQNFVDTITAAITLNWGAAATTISTLVDGVRSTDAFHAGVIGATSLGSYGYCAYGSGGGFNVIDVSCGNVTVDGIFGVVVNSGMAFIKSVRFGTVVKNCVIRGNKPAGASSQQAIMLDTPSCVCTIHDNIWLEIGGGGLYTMANQGAGTLVYNNLGHNCNVGFYSEGLSNRGFYYNNISIGNDTNWHTAPAAIEGAGYNGGESGNTPWNVGTATAITTFVSGDFADYTNHDFRPASSSAHQVEVGTAVPGGVGFDIIAEIRPSYIDGTDAWDLGPFEYDWGNLAPEVRNLVIPTLVSGSQVQIFTTTTTTALTGSTESSGTSLTQDLGADMTVDVTVMKAGYIPLRFSGIVLNATTYTLLVDQEIDRSYVASTGLTYTTNATIDRASKEVAINVDSTLQNARSFWIEQWIDKGANGEALANLDFPFSTNGPNSVTFENGWAWEDWGGGGTGSASIARLSRDGMRYLNTSGNVTKVWAAIYTPDTASGLQVQIEQVNGGTIVAADNTGPMDQLLQIISDPNGDGSYADGYDYTGHLQLRVQAVGYTKPLADVYLTFGTLEDQLYSIGLNPTLQYATTDADPGGMTFTQGPKTAVLTASRSVLQLYQGAQWWTNQDAQWDADVPVTANTAGTVFTIATGWTLSGMNYITGAQTLTGGTITLSGAGTYTPAFSSTTLNAQAAGTYTFTATGVTISATPTSASNYNLANCSFLGSNLFWNTTAYNVTVEIPSGATFSSAGSPGAGTVTFISPVEYQSVTVSGISTTSRVQIYDTTSSTELYNGVAGATSVTWTDSVAAAATRAIRVRIADVVGTAAKEFIEANIGTCATSGAGKDISYLASQTDDATYNANAIDGPSIYATSGITFTDASPDRVNCNIGGGSVTYPTIYACFVYWNFTATGIANDFTYISAPDTANYLLSGMKIRNTSATDLVVSGGYGRDSSTGQSKDIIDTAGSTGNIFLAPDHVVAYQTTGTYAITGDVSTVLTAISNVPPAVRTELSTELARVDVATSTRLATSGYTAPDNAGIAAIPDAATNAAAVFAQAAVTPMPSDVKKVNSATITGTGVPPTFDADGVMTDPGDPWVGV